MISTGFKRRKVDLDFYLHRVFRKKSFRPLQREVISAVVEGHDVFLQASTSFGKSLCFQLPALISHGVTVVVCPLLALMMDQVTALQAIGVPVATINSNTTISERRVIMEDLLSGHPRTRLLYVTPELCQTEAFRRKLQIVHAQGELNRIAIDEAHCISEWGHDFRPAYKELSWFKRTFKNPAVPISAFTATATYRVRSDIISLLGLDMAQLKTFNTPSARPNIHYEVRYLTDSTNDASFPEQPQFDDLISWLKSVQSRREARLGQTNTANLPPISGIIYVPLRSISERLANALTTSGTNIHAVAYHAGLSNEDRSRIQSLWSSPKPYNTTAPPTFTLIVATNAFGMGIDNPCVRFVIHWSPPRSFEGFVQESGRAGRDGHAAASIVYYNASDADRIYERIARETEMARRRNLGRADRPDLQNQQARAQSFEKVVRYCETTSRCRHDLMRELFGDVLCGSSSPGVVGGEGLCDFACDFCKYGGEALGKRKRRMDIERSVGEFEEFDDMCMARGMRFSWGV